MSAAELCKNCEEKPAVDGLYCGSPCRDDYEAAAAREEVPWLGEAQVEVPGRPSHPRREEARTLLRQGFTDVSVAARTTASLSSVKAWRLRLGLTPGRKA